MRTAGVWLLDDPDWVDLCATELPSREACIKAMDVFLRAGGRVTLHQEDCALMDEEDVVDDDPRCDCLPDRYEPERGWDD